MEYWLYQQILSENDDRSPREALQSTINWMRSLAFEISAEHGSSPQDQYDSCLKTFKMNTQGNGVSHGDGVVFECLYLSLTNCLSVTSISSMEEIATNKPWLISGMIVSWYYSYYTAMRAILAASNISAPETHGGVIKSINNNGVLDKLPHPLNMRATWVRNEEYTISFPNFTNAKRSNLTGSFLETRECAQQMLLGYLSGTKTREVGIIKGRLQKDKKLNNFRTNEAKAHRDSKLKGSQFNFMNCAFRYRGKANYRDGIYISYGNRDIANGNEFLEALSFTSRFAFVCSLAFVTHRIGEQKTKAFIDDISNNLRGNNQAKDEERFWLNLIQ